MQFNTRFSQRLAMILLCSVLGMEQTSVEAQEDLSEFVDAALTATSMGELRERNKMLFNHAIPDAVRELKTHPNDGMALRAAWEEVRRTIVEPPSDVTEREAKKIDRRALQRFVGFVEGRLRIVLPDWWEGAMLRASATDQLILFVPGKKRQRPFSRVQDGQLAGVAMSHGTQAYVLENGDLEVFNDSEKTVIPAELWRDLQKASSSLDGLGALTTESHLFLVLYPNSGGRYWLHCIDRGTSRVVWTESVWGEHDIPVNAQGANQQWVDIRLARDAIFVFGKGLFSMYVEVFSTVDGSPVCRFSTAY